MGHEQGGPALGAPEDSSGAARPEELEWDDGTSGVNVWPSCRKHNDRYGRMLATDHRACVSRVARQGWAGLRVTVALAARWARGGRLHAKPMLGLLREARFAIEGAEAGGGIRSMRRQPDTVTRNCSSSRVFLRSGACERQNLLAGSQRRAPRPKDVRRIDLTAS